jgi:hypothetical protein
MKHKLSRMWEETDLASMKVLPKIHLGGLNKAMKALVRLVGVAAEFREVNLPNSCNSCTAKLSTVGYHS